jgi:hypothetical protein
MVTANQTWAFRYFTPAEGPQGAVNFLNEPARQGPGEACAVARNDGSVGLFFLEPGSLGSSDAQTWVFRNFTAAQGTQGAVNFLNEPDRQGPGEASAVARNDGSVGLFFLEPGSLGSSDAQTWVFRNFTAAQGTQGAVNFLNDPDRQGPGEVSAVARNDGSVGLFYLEPGSLGYSDAQAWAFLNFTAAQGTQGAVNFLNEAPRQGPGEASANARNDGSVGLFYLEPGTG